MDQYMADACRIMSQNAASQVHIKNKGDFKVTLLVLKLQLEQTVGKSVNQTGSRGKKMSIL